MDSTADSHVMPKLWPPKRGLRFRLVERMTKNLTTPSIFSRKYGLLTTKEAEDNAKKIEEIAFAAANKHFEDHPDDDGSSALHFYAKHSSKAMLEVLKRGPQANVDAEISDGVVGAVTSFDISRGRRDFIAAEEAAELFKPLREPGNLYLRICLSNRSFGLDAAHVVEPILTKVKSQLKEVDLSDFIAGRPEAEALEVMNIFSSALEGSDLRYLNLSNNALGEKGIKAFEKLLKSSQNLEELYLMNDGISEEAAQALNEMISSTGKLKVLHFHNNMTADYGALAIADMLKRSPALEDFRCSSTRVGSEGGIALAVSLGMCTNLRKLDLRDNMFGVEAGLALSKVLNGLANLTELYLSYLNLEDKGTKALAVALKDCALSLEVLEIAGNDITTHAASSLAECISVKQFLTKLNLAENELKDEGCVLIAKALEEGHGQLTEVDLSSNMIRGAGARLLAQTVANKSGFKLLNINGNYISDDGIDEVKDILKTSSGILGPLDENDPEGEDYDEDAEELIEHEEILGTKFKELVI